MKALQTKSTGRSRVLALFIAIPFLCTHAGADSTGPRAPTVVVSGGHIPLWTSPESAIVSDDVYASVTTDDINSIWASGFDFSVPFGSTVTGVVITVERHSASGNPPALTIGSLRKPDGTNGSPILSADTDAWATTDIVATLGSPDFLWGLSLTLEDVNDPAFTISYGFIADGMDTFFIDAITAEVFFDPPVLFEPCDAFPLVFDDSALFSIAFGANAADLDADGLAEGASLALMEAVACDPFAGESMNMALFNAYNINLIILESEADLDTLDIEADMAGIQDIRSLIALYMGVGAALEAAVNELLAISDPSIVLTGAYVAVTCSGQVCMPMAIDGRALEEEFEVFDRVVRAVGEPFTALGDLDGDGTDNLTEYNNVIAQGGEISDWVIAATSPDLDGTEPIRTPGGPSGGCFIATAAYGTPLAGELNVLRDLRDRVLLRGALGTAFVDTYYRVSPSIADPVSRHSGLAAMVRWMLRPVVLLSEVEIGRVGPLAVCVPALILLALTFRGHRRRRARVQ